MASEELRRLWRLAGIDRQIVELRHRAASLDSGQRLQAEIDKLTPTFNEISTRYKGLQQQVTDLELAQKGDDAKRAKIQKEIYGGKVVNPREVSNLEKEVEMIKKKQDSDSDALLELYDRVPEAKKEFDAASSQIGKLSAARDERRKKALQERAAIEADFQQLMAQRPEATKGISAPLLTRYDHIRSHHGGIGMVDVVKKTSSCGGCGTNLPDRTITLLKDDKLAICESCHRMLYYTEGAV